MFVHMNVESWLTSDTFLHHFPSYKQGKVSSWALTWPVWLVWLASSLWIPSLHLSLSGGLPCQPVFHMGSQRNPSFDACWGKFSTHRTISLVWSIILVHMFHNWEHKTFVMKSPKTFILLNLLFLLYNLSLLKIK